MEGRAARGDEPRGASALEREALEVTMEGPTLHRPRSLLVDRASEHNRMSKEVLMAAYELVVPRVAKALRVAGPKRLIVGRKPQGAAA